MASRLSSPSPLEGAALLGRPSRKIKLFIARMTYGMVEHPLVGTWLARTCHHFLSQPYYGGLTETPIDRSPVYAARNFAARVALDAGFDYLVMVDADMLPDYDPASPVFMDVALKHAMKTGPCVVSSPTPMLNRCVNIHQEIEESSQKHLLLTPIDEADKRSGIEQVPATGTGLILIDTRCFQAIEPPWFVNNYTDVYQSELSAGEDVSFTARLTEAGIPVFAAWDCWSGHRKAETLVRPKRKEEHRDPGQ